MDSNYSNIELITFCKFLLEHDIKIKSMKSFEERMKLSTEESPKYIEKKLKISNNKLKNIIAFLTSKKILSFDMKNDGGPDFIVNIELCNAMIKQLENE